MSVFQHRIVWFIASSVAGTILFLEHPRNGQARADNVLARGVEKADQRHGRQPDTSQAGKSIPEQLRELRSKVVKLEAALQKKHMGTGRESHGTHGVQGHGKGQSGSDGSSSHGKSSRKGKTSAHGKSAAKGKMAMGKKSMSGGKMAGTGMMTNGMGMMRGGMGMANGGMSMMGRMKGMGQMTVASALPGFPGASHIYHIGATSFFLDHPQHITLALDQKTKLNKIKEDALLKQATFDRSIEGAEQELWVLTSADKPDAAKIESKIGEIARLGVDKRIAFIRAVGQAANVLTDEQRKKLVGTLPADHKSAGSKARTGKSASGKNGD